MQRKLTMLETLHAEKLISDRLYDERKRGLVRNISSVQSINTRQTQRLSRNEILPRLSNSALPSNEARRFALIIGADNYKYYPPLQSAINDARAISSLLKSSFNFEIQLLENPDRQQLLTALSHYRHSLRSDDQFLLYYAGHGHFDTLTQRGYWLPVNAEKSNPTNWISTADISDALLALPASQALVIADSCYAGSLANEDAIGEANSRRVNLHRSRTVITSGGLEPVLDSGANGHSVFANAFIEQLTRFRKGDTVRSLFTRLREQVKNQAQQIPKYSIISDAGHEIGEFTLHHY